MVAIAPAFSGGEGSANGGISPEAGGGWSLDGAGLTAVERDVLRGQLACFALAVVLQERGGFSSEVEQIRKLDGPLAQGTRAWELAGRVGRGGRRRAIAKLLLSVADAEPDSRRAALQLLGARAVWGDEEGGGRSRTYRVGEAFLGPVRQRAQYVARALTAYCLCSEDPPAGGCSERASAGSRYCSRHDASEEVREKDRRERDLRALLDVVKPAILAAPPLRYGLRAALETVDTESSRRAKRAPPRPRRAVPVEPAPSPAIAPGDRAEFERLMALAPDPDARHRIAERLAAVDKQAEGGRETGTSSLRAV